MNCATSTIHKNTMEPGSGQSQAQNQGALWNDPESAPGPLGIFDAGIVPGGRVGG
jgi:hypothetical protein